MVLVEAKHHVELDLGGITTYLRWITGYYNPGVAVLSGPGWFNSGPCTPYGYFGMSDWTRW